MFGISLLFALCSNAQTTRGLVSGRVTDSESGQPIEGAAICYAQQATNTAGIVYSGPGGFYAIPSLPPGDYNIRVVKNSADDESVCLAASAGEYQPIQLHGLNLPVAGRIDLPVQLRHISRVWERGLENRYVFPKNEAVVTYYGPDVDTSRFGSFDPDAGSQGALEATLSNVIDPRQVRQLPFAGRDIYTMLVTQPGVAADTGTGRGLGLSIFGGRPSGFLANAVTRAGGTDWHGAGYFNFRNDALNANEFQRNLAGKPRTPFKELQPGFPRRRTIGEAPLRVLSF